jgi:hypothetical protein
MKKFDITNYNEASQQFLNRYVGKDSVICVKQNHSRKDENFIFYKRGNDIKVCVLTLKDSKNNGSCFYGDLKYYAKSIFCNVYGYKFENICYWYDRRSMLRIERVINAYLYNN